MPDSSDSPSPRHDPAAFSSSDAGAAEAEPVGDTPAAPLSFVFSPLTQAPVTQAPASQVPVQVSSSATPADSASSDPLVVQLSAPALGASVSGGARTSAAASAPSRTPAPDDDLPHYTLGEEIMNSVTHGVGCLLAIAGLVLLIVKAALGGAQPAHIASALVFGVTLILEYLASTLYHAIAPRGAKRVFRIIDHSCIYLLIAGSYTPFLLITLRDAGGIPMFFVVWTLALVGVAFEVGMRQRQPRWLTILIYLGMGWLVIFRLRELVAALDPVALVLLAVGGVCYTLGTPFYCMKKIRYMHSVFHLWVLAGSIFQFMAVILFVI